MIDDAPQIYKDMCDYLVPYVNKLDGVPIPFKTLEYLNTRRDALSNAFCRAEDTAGQHLTWLQYHYLMSRESSLVDMVAWETLYKELGDDLDIPIEVFECLEISLSADPMKPIIKPLGLKAPLHDNKTTPTYVALALKFAEEKDWDITELYPPVLGLEMEDVNIINDYLYNMTGMEMNVLNELMSSTKGLEVWLA